MKKIKRYLWVISLSFLFTNPGYAKDFDDFSVKLSDGLNRLSDFEDIVVIQRRFLQKTGRFELSLSSPLFFSSEFFFKLGLGTNVSFYFLEKHGFELKGFYLFPVNRKVSRDMFKELRIDTDVKGLSTIGFAGLLYKWTPIYGKMAWINKKIVPFDFSLFLGGGMSQLQRCRGIIKNCERWAEPTLALGFGQSYALSRNLALRVDMGFHYYGGLFSTNIPSGEHYWDTYMNLGVNFYFPKRILR